MKEIYVWIDEENKEIYFSTSEDQKFSDQYRRVTYEEARELCNINSQQYRVLLL